MNTPFSVCLNRTFPLFSSRMFFSYRSFASIELPSSLRLPFEPLDVSDPTDVFSPSSSLFCSFYLPMSVSLLRRSA